MIKNCFHRFYSPSAPLMENNVLLVLHINDQFVEIRGSPLPRKFLEQTHTLGRIVLVAVVRRMQREERYAEFLAAVRRIMGRWPYVCIPLCNGPLYRAIPPWKRRNATGCRIHRPLTGGRKPLVIKGNDIRIEIIDVKGVQRRLVPHRAPLSALILVERVILSNYPSLRLLTCCCDNNISIILNNDKYLCHAKFRNL